MSTAVKPCPFPGMRPFQECEARYFFGRSNQIRICLSLLGTKRSLAILGTSGAGKSSLIQAGLLPAIQRGIFDELPDWEDSPFTGSGRSDGDPPKIVIFSPGQNPLDSFASALVNASDGRLTEQRDHDRVVDLLRSGAVSGDSLLRSLGWRPQAVLVLIADQLEELFLRPFLGAGLEGKVQEGRQDVSFPDRGFSHRSQVARFVDALNLISSARTFRTFTVLGMRSDFLKDCSDYPALADQIAASLFIIPALTWSEMEEAITKPVALLAQDANRESPLTPDLVVQLLNQVTSSSDSLPLLQNFLADLYREAQKTAATQGSIGDRVAAFVSLLEKRLGDEGQSMARGADLLQRALDGHGRRLMAESGIEPQTIRLFFSCLMRVDAGDRVLRRKLTRQAICHCTRLEPEEIHRLEETFAKAEFPAWVSIARGSVSELDEFTISHEALLRNWSLFEESRGLPLSMEAPAILRMPKTGDLDSLATKKLRLLGTALSEVATFESRGKGKQRLNRRIASTETIATACGITEEKLREIVISTQEEGNHPLLLKNRGKTLTINTSSRALELLEPMEAGLANRARHLAEVIRDLRRRRQGLDLRGRGLSAKARSDSGLLITDREEHLLAEALRDDPRTPESFWLAHDCEPLGESRELVTRALKQKRDARHRRKRLILFQQLLATLVIAGIVSGVYFWKESERAKAEAALTRAEASAALAKAEAGRAKEKTAAEAALARIESARARATAQTDAALAKAALAKAEAEKSKAEAERAKAEAAQATAKKLAAEEARQRDLTTARLFQEELARRDEILANPPRISASDHLGPEPMKAANSAIDRIISVDGQRILVGSSSRPFEARNGPPLKLGDLVIDPVKGIIFQQVEQASTGWKPRGTWSQGLIYDPEKAMIALKGGSEPETILALEKSWGIPQDASAFLRTGELNAVAEAQLAVGLPGSRVLFASGKLGLPFKTTSLVPLDRDTSWKITNVAKLSNSTYCVASREGDDVGHQANTSDKPATRTWRVYWQSDQDKGFKQLIECGTEVFLYPLKGERCILAHDQQLMVFNRDTKLLEGQFGEIQSGIIGSVSAWEDAACNLKWLAVGFDGGEVGLVKWPEESSPTADVPKVLASSDLLILNHQADRITSMQFSPSAGKHLAVGDASGRIVLWQDLETRFRKRLATVPFEAFSAAALPRLAKNSEPGVSSLRFDTSGDCLYAGFEDGCLCKIPIVVRSDGKWIPFFLSHGNELALYPKGLGELKGADLVTDVEVVTAKGFTSAWKRVESHKQTILDRDKFYLAARWDYSFTPLLRLRRTKVHIIKLKDGNPTGESVDASPVDYGPREEKGSFVLSDGIKKKLGLVEGEKVRIEFQPFPPIEESDLAPRRR